MATEIIFFASAFVFFALGFIGGRMWQRMQHDHQKALDDMLNRAHAQTAERFRAALSAFAVDKNKTPT